MLRAPWFEHRYYGQSCNHNNIIIAMVWGSSVVNAGGRAAVLCSYYTASIIKKMQTAVCCDREGEKCALFCEAYWVLTDDEAKEEECPLCTCCDYRFDILLCYVVIALGLAVYVPLYILCCGLCNFTIFLVEKGREKRREARERVTSERQQKRDRGVDSAEEKESTVGEKDRVQSVCLEIEEGETTVHEQ